MKSVIRSFRLAAEIFSPGLLIVVVLTSQYIANPVNAEKKLKPSNQKKNTISIRPFPKPGIS